MIIIWEEKRGQERRLKPYSPSVTVLDSDTTTTSFKVHPVPWHPWQGLPSLQPLPLTTEMLVFVMETISRPPPSPFSSFSALQTSSSTTASSLPSPSRPSSKSSSLLISMLKLNSVDSLETGCKVSSGGEDSSGCHFTLLALCTVWGAEGGVNKQLVLQDVFFLWWRPTRSAILCHADISSSIQFNIKYCSCNSNNNSLSSRFYFHSTWWLTVKKQVQLLWKGSTWSGFCRWILTATRIYSAWGKLLEALFDRFFS